jgi:hypothetical protein
MAEDVTTDLMTMLFRATGSRRKGFTDESFVLIKEILPEAVIR